MLKCNLLNDAPLGHDTELFMYGKSLQPFDPWVASSCVGAVVKIPWSEDPDIVQLMFQSVVDVPLYLRSATAGAAWYKGIVDKARQDELEKSKQNKPNL